MSGQRIVIADQDPAFRKSLKAMLIQAGYWVVGDAGDGVGALKMVRGMQPDLVMVSFNLPAMGGLELAQIIHDDKLAPVILLASSGQQEILQKAKEIGAFALLIKPLDENNLVPAIEMALANYSEIVRLETEIRQLRETLETRKLVERAKGLLMERLGLTEDEAFKKMRRQSMNKRVPMRAVAEAIILTYTMGEG